MRFRWLMLCGASLCEVLLKIRMWSGWQESPGKPWASIEAHAWEDATPTDGTITCGCVLLWETLLEVSGEIFLSLVMQTSQADSPAAAVPGCCGSCLGLVWKCCSVTPACNAGSLMMQPPLWVSFLFRCLTLIFRPHHNPPDSSPTTGKSHFCCWWLPLTVQGTLPNFAHTEGFLLPLQLV